jgi:uroporphyrinogen decarboxylase
MTFAYAGIERPAREDLASYLGLSSADEVYARFDRYVDIALVGPDFRRPDPDYRGPAVRQSESEFEDIWGCHWVLLSPDRGSPWEIRRQPLAEITDVADVRRHPWPKLEWWDWDSVGERIAHARDHKDYALMMHSGNLFERTWWMRGFERCLYDLVDAPDVFHAMMRQVTDCYVAVTRRLLEIADGAVDLAFTADDIGGQDGLLISPPMWEQHIKPYHAEMNRVIRGHGAKVVYHSDGSVMEAVPGLLDMGIDVLQALQFSARGMDPCVLKDTYGDRLCFQGGISVQTTLPFGSVEDVREEVRQRIQVLGKGGGYILSPSHTIMPGTPPGNVIAMLETAAATPVPRR